MQGRTPGKHWRMHKQDALSHEATARLFADWAREEDDPGARRHFARQAREYAEQADASTVQADLGRTRGAGS